MSKHGKMYLLVVFLLTVTMYMGDYVTNPFVLLIIPAAFIWGYVSAIKKD